jgi:carbonic anhydrase
LNKIALFCDIKQKQKMIKNIIKITTLVLTVQIFFSCNTRTKNEQSEITSENQKSTYKNRHVMSKAEQDSLTPTQVLQEFKDGNDRFNSGNVTQREHSEEIRKVATGGQFPKAMVLSCLDSRVPVEDVFDQGIGDVFVGRVAGNFVNTDLLGSMEFACKVAGAKLILVMGHQHCGAVKGAIDDVHLGNITSMLANIKPAVEMSKTFEGEKSSKNEAYVKLVAQNNIRNTIAQIRAKSEILKEMEAKGQIKIVGVFYTLRTGKLEFID